MVCPEEAASGLTSPRLASRHTLGDTASMGQLSRPVCGMARTLVSSPKRLTQGCTEISRLSGHGWWMLSGLITSTNSLQRRRLIWSAVTTLATSHSPSRPSQSFPFTQSDRGTNPIPNQPPTPSYTEATTPRCGARAFLPVQQPAKHVFKRRASDCVYWGCIDCSRVHMRTGCRRRLLRTLGRWRRFMAPVVSLMAWYVAIPHWCIFAPAVAMV